MINIMLLMGCSIKSTVELQNTKKAYETAQISIYGDFYEDVINNEKVPNSVKKYINREVIYELSYAKSQMQKSWEEYASAEYKSSITYAELAQSHIDRALEIHSNTQQSESSDQLSSPAANENQEQSEEQDNSKDQLDQSETSQQEN